MGISASAEHSHNRPHTRGATSRWLASVAIIGLILGASLFVSSGHLGWRMAWAYMVVFASTQVLIALLVIRENPDLAAERAQREASPAARWDRALAGVVGLFGPAATLVVAGLDKRFGRSEVSPPLQLTALATAVLASLLTVWAMASNRFFYGHVRIEMERGHTVATTGPYQIVRHPGYLGGVMFDLAAPALLGSLWAFVPAALTVAALVVRTSLEDRTLQEGLDGYRDYAQRVRCRLLPGVW